MSIEFNNTLADRINMIAPSGSISIANKITQLREEGHKIIGLNIGEPDFQTPDVVLKGTKKALTQGKTKYSAVSGEKILREAIAKYFFSRNQRLISINNILVSNGSKQAIYNAFQAILNVGDEVIIPIPYWVTIPESIKLAGGKEVLVDSLDNFHLDLVKIKKSITSKTKAIYINTPNNPTGVVYNEQELRELGSLAKENNLWIISDEAYECLTYDQKFVSINTLSDDLFNRTICIQSFSKTFCMTGFRLGYMIANFELIKGVDKFQGHLCGNVPPFTQIGAAKALAIHEQITFPLIQEMKKRRDISFELFSKLFKCQMPEGAFYLFLDISPYIQRGLIKDSSEMVEFLIENAKVALVPGSAFGLEGYIRLSYTAPVKEIQKAFKQIEKVLKK